MSLPTFDHLSYSGLSSLACPYAFFLRYDAGLRGPTTPWMALGNAVHLGLQLGHNDNGFDVNLAVKTFEKEFNRIVIDDDVFVGYPQLRKHIAEGTDMLVLYDTQIQAGLLTKTPMALEKPFEITIAGIKIVGRIDKIEREYDPETGEDEYVLSDFKSGKEKPDAWFLSKDVQFTVYYQAIKELYGKYPKKAYYHHLRSGELLETTRTEEDIKRLTVMVENAKKMRDMGIRHRTYNPVVCGRCSYKGAVCDDPTLEETTLTTLMEADYIEDELLGDG